MLAVPVLLLCACSSNEAWEEQPTPGDPDAPQYINLTISVSNGSQQTSTRAPLGGEDGDGREQAFERENAIKNITFILADGSLNSNTAKIAFIKHYPVSEITANYPEDSHGHTYYDTAEKKYTTGYQLVDRAELDMTEDKTYYVYVVANRWINANKGDNLSNIKDKTLGAYELFSGDGYNPDGCFNYIMASEQDFTVNFANASDIDKIKITNSDFCYQLKRPIIIERHAARIDFCTAYSSNTKNAAYGTYNVNVGGTATTKSGFKYETVPAASGGYFILESITPFNIYNEQQYLFERVTDGWTGTPTTTYLGRETTTNYIVDPRTADKVSTTLNYESPLSATMATTWQRTAASLNSQTSKTKVVSSTTDDNFVVAYCMENPLLPTSPLKNYATGLVITGSFYDKNNNFVSQRTFYEYLRHQDSGTTYTTTELTADNLSADTRTSGTTTAMRFSIVRNNIYRVSIENIDSKGRIKLKLAVHDWREVTHPDVYI